MIQLVRDQCDLRKQKNGKYPLLGWDKLKYFTKKNTIHLWMRERIRLKLNKAILEKEKKSNESKSVGDTQAVC